MIAEAIRRSALAEYVDRFAFLSAASNRALSIRELPFLSQITLRVSPSETGAMLAIARELGFALPVEPNTVASGGGRSCLWLGPDEWLIVARPDQQVAVEASLRSALGEHGGAVVDVSANRTVIEVTGPAARGLLAHGCAVDLHPKRFEPGHCVQTLLARAGVMIHLIDVTPTFHLYVRASFAAYLADWLLDASGSD